MRKSLLSLLVVGCVVGLGAVSTPASADTVSTVNGIQTVQYYGPGYGDWRAREWRRAEWERHRHWEEVRHWREWHRDAPPWAERW